MNIFIINYYPTVPFTELPYKSSFLINALLSATLSITKSVSNAMRMSFSVAININAASLLADRLLLSLFFMNLRVGLLGYGKNNNHDYFD